MDWIATYPEREDPKNVYCDEDEKAYFDYSPRALWLRAVVLAVLYLMGQVSGNTPVPRDQKIRAVFVAGFAGLLAGAVALAMAEFVSVYTQHDIMKFQAKRDAESGRRRRKWLIPRPAVVAVSAGMAHLLGGSLVLLSAGFVRNHMVRGVLAVAVASLSMLVVGTLGAVLGRAPVVRSCARVLGGGLVAISIIWGKSEIIQKLGT